MSGIGSAAPAAEVESRAPALAATNFAKRFGAQRALKGVDLSIGAGEVVALLGENGSGKTTVVKILAGYHVPEPGGGLKMDGVDVPLPVALGEARSVGLSFVYQDLGLANELQVVENLFVGHRVTRGFGSARRIRWRDERTRAREIFDSYGVDVDSTALVGSLRPTSQALVAIVRAAWELREYREQNEQAAGVLVLDEPTVFLPEHEKVFLYELIRRVIANGFGVLFVSHDMSAVREIAGRAVVLRDGAKVGDVMLTEATDAELIELVSGHHQLGRETIETETAAGQDAVETEHGSVVLSVRGLSAGRARDVGFDIHAGEILGIAGLLGGGSEDLPYALFGDSAGAAGEVSIGEWSGTVSELTPSRAIALGVALVPADRKQYGVVAELPVALNMLSLSLKRFVRRRMLQGGKLRATAAQRAETYDVRPRNVDLNMSSLSGGNQQKVVLARWLEQGPRLLLLHEPTQGVDVTTRDEIYKLMRERARAGVAILWVSTDFDELASIAHRILLCANGVIAGAVAPPFSRDRIISDVYATAAGGGQREMSAS